MTGKIWVVRAGEASKFAEVFLAGGYIAVGFSEVAAESLSTVDSSAIKQRATDASAKTRANQLAHFVGTMSRDDIVLVPRREQQDLLVARVTGDYSYSHISDGGGHHRREVTWLGKLSRSVLSVSAKNTLGSISTIFRPRAAEAEIRSLLTALEPISEGAVPRRPFTSDGPDLPVVITRGAAPSLAESRFTVQTEPSGRALISSEYPALAMEQVPRHLDPLGAWTSVPGVYVLTGTELEQDSTRTGVERTLTTTSIVRPWAYVGLSEDLPSRLRSHRANKPQWRRALLVRSGANPFSSDDIKYLERSVYDLLEETGEVSTQQSTPRGNLSAQPQHPIHLDACAASIVALLRLTGTLI